MIRHDCQPRADYLSILESQGLTYHTNADGSPYWKEDAYYVLSNGEVTALYEAAQELHHMFLAAAEHVLNRADGLTRLELPVSLHEVVRRSWEEDEWEFYGRFDLTFDAGGKPKLIEYNADTPTGLLEASIAQWHWKNERYPRNDQFNSIHEGLVSRWTELVARGQIGKELTHFTSVANHAEDRMTVGYVAQVAENAGSKTTYLPISRIGWSAKRGEFVDEENRVIEQIFKLYPWEWLAHEPFAPNLRKAGWAVLEPPWKAIFASKKLLLVLQELYPGHPNLLAVSEHPPKENFVAKPVFGREGANVTLYRNGREIDRRPGSRTSESMIYQEYCPLVRAKAGLFAQCGVWMAGPEPVGLGVREDGRAIFGNTSAFVPHIMV